MGKRFGLLTAFIILLGTNAFLFVALRQQTTTLALAHEKLINQLGASDFQQTNDYRLENMGRETWGKELSSTAFKFSAKIDSLKAFINWETSRKPDDYFGSATSINPKFQAELWTAAEEFNQKFRQHLETKIPKEKKYFRDLREIARQQFELITRKANNSTNGRHKAEFKFQFFRNTEAQALLDQHTFDLKWTKKDDTVVWHYEEYDGTRFHHLNYLTMLDEKINSPYAFQTKKLLSKMARSFTLPGKLSVYDNTYDLNRITPAKLVSACQYLELLKSEIERSFIATCQDASLVYRYR